MHRRAFGFIVTAAFLAACGDGTGPDAAERTRVVAGSVRVGNVMGCGRLVEDGAWACWGLDISGRFGLGTAEQVRRPVTRLALPVAMAEIVPGGQAHTCGLDGEGQAWCWGSNANGRLGVGAAEGTVASPRAVATGLRFASLHAAPYAFTQVTCGITADGALHCWGLNTLSGILGTGDTQDRATPTRVEGLPPVTSVTLGRDHACALTADGAAWCWGDNRARQIADSATDAILTPVRVAPLLAFRQVAVGGWTTCGLTTGGETWCWGTSLGGELGAYTGPATATPQLVARDTAFAELRSDGHQQYFGRDAAGRIHRWGDSGGDTRLAVPTELLPGTTFRDLAVGTLDAPLAGDGACGTTTGDVLVCAVASMRRVGELGAEGLVEVTGRGVVPFPEGD